MISIEELIDQCLITDGAFDEDMLDRGIGCNDIDLLQPPFLQTYLVVVVHVVERDNRSGRKGLEETDHKIRANEAGGTGYEDGFVVEINWGFHEVVSSLNKISLCPMRLSLGRCHIIIAVHIAQ